jgi:hypothetical protein
MSEAPNIQIQNLFFVRARRLESKGCDFLDFLVKFRLLKMCILLEQMKGFCLELRRPSPIVRFVHVPTFDLNYGLEPTVGLN